MKRLALVAVLCAVAGLAACGDDRSSAGSERPPGKLTKPEIQRPSQPPKEIAIDTLWEGSGPEAEPDDIMTIHYLGVDEAGKELYASWKRSGPITYELGSSDFFPGWDEGLEGMKVGDRREIAFPASSTDGLGPLFYVVDLLKVQKPRR